MALLHRRHPLCWMTGILCCGLLSSAPPAGTQASVIQDDPALDAMVAQARSEFLAMKPYVTRLDATVLLPTPDGIWRRGSYNGETVAYPASTVKICYLAAAMEWCRTNNHPYDFLDWCVRPMIVDSDNVATGHVVDHITGAPNYPATSQDEAFQAWYDQRTYTEKFLASRGLLGNQTILNKTYPTNSGDSPSGAEQLAIERRGKNRMQPNLTASLMLELCHGRLEPAATAYMRELLTHERWSGNSEFGFGLPPGSLYENKVGLAYDTLEDVAYILLPNGKELVLAAFSNGFTGPEPKNPYPYDSSLLGGFAELLIERLGLDAGNPPKRIVDNSDPAVVWGGPWIRRDDKAADPDMFGPNFLSVAADATGSATITWPLNPPEPGTYEVCVWSPQRPTAARVSYLIRHADGESSISLNQTQCGGRWVKFGDYRFAAGQGSVTLRNFGSPTQMVLADAVKIVKWPAGLLPEWIADNDAGAPTYVESGAWSTSSSPGYNHGAYRHAPTGKPASATWTVNLPQDGDYALFVVGKSGENRASKVRYDISTASGTQTVYANQRQKDLVWVKLGTFNMKAGRNTVRIDAGGSSGGAVVIADAVGWSTVTGGAK